MYFFFFFLTMSLISNLFPAAGIEVWNPAFDVTPHQLITGGIITELGVFLPSELQAALTGRLTALQSQLAPPAGLCVPLHLMSHTLRHSSHYRTHTHSHLCGLIAFGQHTVTVRCQWCTQKKICSFSPSHAVTAGIQADMHVQSPFSYVPHHFFSGFHFPFSPRFPFHPSLSLAASFSL